MPLTPAKVILAGLDPLIASELSTALRTLSVEVVGEESSGPAAAFCSPVGLADFCLNHPDLPVVAVSRTGEVGEWLDAIDAGARDYCSSPFEPSLISWILESVSRPSVLRAA